MQDQNKDENKSQLENKKISILFVDDDKFLLDLYSLKFSSNNFDVHIALSSEDALKTLKDGFIPDVMLLDVVMPSMNGVELLTVLRKENIAKDSVIIMLTNQGTPEDIALVKKLNVAGYIVKATTLPTEVLSEVQNIYSKFKK
jgi:DNA-binding response OmpR family regulator